MISMEELQVVSPCLEDSECTHMTVIWTGCEPSPASFPCTTCSRPYMSRASETG